MLRLIGIIFLVGGSFGLGLSMKNRMKDNLNALYQVQQIFKMLQNEITYSKAPLPEACRRIGSRIKEPYGRAFHDIYEKMLLNSGCSFSEIWKECMKKCLKGTALSEEEKRVCLDFADCAGYMDGKMQAEAIEQYLHRLELSVKKLEEDMINKSKVIMSLSVMGGLLVAIILI
ncbi:stage III sporulation protein AB [Kineothrix sedimenti]|uniref:Stage III sporulation protein AB n=1 Tax=Kineothrix sedimenti TaxID=3123317 RepID=A0ABZ3F3X9_9FIRM